MQGQVIGFPGNDLPDLKKAPEKGLWLDGQLQITYHPRRMGITEDWCM
jgi:hypothetical protein